jgi:NADH-quinone oxidoreductase subunit M
MVMQQIPILSILTFLPLFGALFILFFVNSKLSLKLTALWTSFTTFLVSLLVYHNFDSLIASYQFEEKISWIQDMGMSYHLGLDGISLFFVLLTTFLIPICLLASWSSVEKRLKEYVIAFLLLESLVIGSFVALDLVLFFLFFEMMLIPMFLIIGIWGGDNRIYAAFKFFLYTLAGSVFFLLAIIYLSYNLQTTDIPELVARRAEIGGLDIQKYLWIAIALSFAVKIPMWPVHTWLPDAHVQAPTAGSVILAGILLKLGGYGFLRILLPMMPEASHYFAPFMFAFSIIAIIYASLVALAQEDMKKLIAYSSVAHMGYVTLGIFAFNQEAIQGAMVQMISHGLVSGALFLCVGVLYDRMHTKLISKYGGVVEVMPKFALIFLFFTMASIGLPGTSGFIGEFLTLLGSYKVSKFYALLATSGVVLGAAYMLWLYKRVVFGEIKNKEVQEMPDLSCRELIIFIPIVILVIYLGVYPSSITNKTYMSISNLLELVK